MRPETAESPAHQPATSAPESEPSSGSTVPGNDAASFGMPSDASRQSKPQYIATVYPGPDTPLLDGVAEAIKNLQEALGMPIWMLVHDHHPPYPHLDEDVVIACRQARTDLPKDQRIGLLIASPGGDARSAYQTAMIFRKQCREVIAIVPGGAKSAATLLALCADEIILGTDGELGPLDAQVYDPDREDFRSALDEFQALERLHAFALEAFDRSMLLLVGRTSKKTDVLMPIVSHFVTEMVRPLFEKIDAVHYTQVARALKVAEDYAVRLLMPRYEEDKAQRIARHLVQRYSEHGFVIDAQEARSIGLKIAKLSADQVKAVDAFTPMIEHGLTVIGCLKERVNK